MKQTIISIALALMCAAVANAGSKVLVAQERSSFKDTLVQSLTRQLEQQGIQAELVKPDELSKQDPRLYAAVVLVNSIWAGKLGRTFDTFLGRSDVSKSRVLIINTAGGGKAFTTYKGVDAVTTPSLPAKADSLGRALATVVQKKAL